MGDGVQDFDSKGPESSWGAIAGVELRKVLWRGSRWRVFDGARGLLRVAVTVGEVLSDEDVRTFHRAVANRARVVHPGLSRVLACGVEDGLFYQVSALPDGPRLSQRVRSGAMLEPEIRDVIRQLAGALHAAHRLGVIVGQVTPDTLLLTPSGIKICDIFPLLHQQSGPFTAPEVLGDAPDMPDERVDIFAVGAIAWFAVTGRPPPASGSRDSRRLHPDTYGISRGLAWLIGHLLEDDPRRRFQNMVEVLDALDQVEVADEQEPEVRRSEKKAQVAAGFDIPLVGREQTLAALERFRVAAREGNGCSVVVTGPPGAGRSRLLYEMARRSRVAGDTVLFARCEADDHTPLGVCRELVEAYLAQATRHEGFGESLRAATVGIDDLIRGLSPELDRFLPELESEAGLHEHHAFHGALASFLIRLGSVREELVSERLQGVVHGGAVSQVRTGSLVVVIDDAQWLDLASIQVLRHLAVELQSNPVLLLLAVREPPSDVLWQEQLAPAPVQTLALSPMTATEVGALCRAMVWYPLAPRIVALIIARTGGHARSVVAFVQVMLDEGVMLPNWGEWDVDMGRFGALALPGSADALISRRVASLEPQIREVMATAACIGRRIDVDILSSLCGSELVQAALQSCISNRIVGRRGRLVAFLHQQVVDILRASLQPGERARIHGLIARQLRLAGLDRPENLHRAAHHAWQSAPATKEPEFVIELLLQAGRSVSRYAPEATRMYLQSAAELLEGIGKQLTRQDALALGLAYANCGELEQACQAIESALARATSPMQRAKLRVELGRIHLLELDADKIRREVEQGLAELKLPPLRGHFTRRARALLARTLRPRSRRPHDAVPELERGKLLLQLLELGGQFAYLQGKIVLGMQLASRAFHEAQRLHPCAEQAKAIMSYSVGLALTGRRTGFVSESERALEIARRVGGQGLEATLMAARAMGHEILGDIQKNELDLRAALSRGRLWFPVEMYASCALTLARNLDQRGYPNEATTWVSQACLRLQLATRDGLPHFHSVLAYVACLDAACGRREQAQESLAFARQALKGVTARADAARNYLAACDLRVLFELRRFDAEFERAAEQFLLDVTAPDPAMQFTHDGFILLAHYELERLVAQRRMGQAQPDPDVTKLKTAISRLHPLRHIPLISLQIAFVEATLRWLRGETASAHRRWSDTAKRAHQLDCPRVLAAISRFRAHALIEEGAREAGLREAKNAAKIAGEQGLSNLEAWIREDFQLADVTRRPDSADTLVSVGTGVEVTSHRIRQHFDTLLQIRMSALRQTSAAGQAKAILHELMLVLGASRGWMIAYTDKYPEYEVVYGCTSEGRELLELDAASRHVVEQTRDSGELSIGNGPAGEEVEATASHLWSATSRSLMAAPIRLGDSDVGIVCLDNRLSGSTFSRADEQMLQAMAGHIALAGELLAARLKAQSEATGEVLSGVLEQACQVLSCGVLALARNGSLVHVSDAVAELTAAWAEPAVWWRSITETGVIDPTWVGLGDGAHHVVSVELVTPGGGVRVFELSFTGEVHPLVGFGDSQVVLVADTTRGSRTELELRAKRNAVEAERELAAAELRSRKSLRVQLVALLTTATDELTTIDDPREREARLAGLLDVVKRVSRVARIESGELPLSANPIELTGLVNQIYSDVSGELSARGGDLLIDLRTRDAIASDRVLLRQILGELVGFIAGGCERPDVLLEVWIDRHGAHPVCVFEISRPQQTEVSGAIRDEIGQLALSVTQHAVGLLRGTLQLHANDEARRVLTFTLPVGDAPDDIAMIRR